MGNDTLAVDMPEPASVVGSSYRMSPEPSSGTFHLPLQIVRRDLAADVPGVPLMVRFRIVTPDGTPLPGAVLDLWHQSPDPDNARLRAAQMSDADGEVRFRTVFPGWHPAHDPHLTARLHAGGGRTFAGRFTFEPALTRSLATLAPYQVIGLPRRSPLRRAVTRTAAGHQLTVVPRDRFDLAAGLLTTVTLTA